MPGLHSMKDLLIDELRDLHDTEKRLVATLPKIAKAASSPELKAVFTAHLRVAEHQVTRLEEALESLNLTLPRKLCMGIQGLIAEGEKHIEISGNKSVLDAALIAHLQKVGHYEIAAYGSAREHATSVGRSEIAELLQQSLDEQKEADRIFTVLATDLINPQAANAGEPEGWSEESEEHLANPSAGTTLQHRW